MSFFAVVSATAVLAVWTLGCAMLGITPKRVSLQDQLQGKWAARLVDGDVDITAMSIEGDKISIDTSSGDYFKGTLKLNEQESPAHMDLTLTDSSMANLVGETGEGIVKVEGSKVTWCLGEVRPMAFDTSEGLLIVGEKK
ncbi:hypothetical protein AMJ85_07735 [candidate division BRC1 bacterium SM23_51]|nr:MAG: hypothetical protein AMJ85_07735 [candidate division BRC1 bacterium SM23_51]